MNNLKERDWANINVDVQNMTWSPIHVTQRLQENKLEFDRVVLVGSKTISTNPGRVESYKWKSKKVVLNSFLSIPNTFTAEIMSEQGYDSLTIDYQHGMIGFNDLFTSHLKTHNILIRIIRIFPFRNACYIIPFLIF